MDKVNQWLTLLANFGVVVGIAFLIIEIRQNDQMLSEDHRLREATAFQEMEARYMDGNKQIASNAVLAELLVRTRAKQPKFSRKELLMLSNFVAQYARIDHTAYRLWVAGHLSETAWQGNSRNIERHRSSEELWSRLYMRAFVYMPKDIKDHFNIQDYPEELLNLEAFLIGNT